MKPAKLLGWLQLPLPLLIAGAAVCAGYHACDHWMTELDLFLLSPFWVPGALLLCAVSSAILGWNAPKGRRAYVIFLHLLVVALVAVFSVAYLPSSGQWVWEQVHLKPRREALIEFARGSSIESEGSVRVAGYRFEGIKRVSQGTMFFTVMAGGPLASWGVFVPRSSDFHRFEAAQERDLPLTPTSINGLYWFTTTD